MNNIFNKKVRAWGSSGETPAEEMNKTTGLCHGSVPRASTPKSLTGDGHNIHMVPICKSLLNRANWVERQVIVWNEESIVRRQGCFDCTEMFPEKHLSSSLDELTFLSMLK